MALIVNPTRLKLRRQANKDVKAKTYWDSRLQDPIRKLLKEIGYDFETIYENSGVVLDASHYTNECEAILRDYYRKISYDFQDNVRESLPKDYNAHLFVKSVSSEIETAIIKFNNANAKTASAEIMKTTQADINARVESARREAREQELDPRKYVAETVGLYLRALAPGRAATVSMTEVQTCAEGTKQIEASIVRANTPKKATIIALENKARVVVAPAGPGFFGKSWVATLDQRTRSFHADADFQNVGTDEYFTVNGEPMFNPGDKSASIENWINCRCTGIQYISTNIVTPGVIPEGPETEEEF